MTWFPDPSLLWRQGHGHAALAKSCCQTPTTANTAGSVHNPKPPPPPQQTLHWAPGDRGPRRAQGPQPGDVPEDGRGSAHLLPAAPEEGVPRPVARGPLQVSPSERPLWSPQVHRSGNDPTRVPGAGGEAHATLARACAARSADRGSMALPQCPAALCSGTRCCVLRVQSSVAVTALVACLPVPLNPVS